MRKMNWLAAALFAASGSWCVPATAQKVSDLPAATTLGGAEMLAGSQGSGCATHVAPCASVRISPAQIATYVNAGIDAQLAALAALTPAADKCSYWTGLTAAALYDCTSFMRGLGGSTDAAAARSTLGAAASGSNSDITALSGLTTPLSLAQGGTAGTSAATARTSLGVTATGSDTAYNYRANNLSDVASASTARTNLGLAIGTNVQAYSSVLTTYAGITPSANVQSLLGAADYGAMRALMATSWVPCKSAVAVVLTGTTAETTLATCTLPGNTMGPNGQVEIVGALFSFTNNANTKTPRFKFGSLTFQSSASSGTAGQQIAGRVANRNATNAQVAFAGSGTGFGTSTSNAPVTSAIDTTANVDITITGQLANSADTMTLESYMIRVTYGP